MGFATRVTSSYFRHKAKEADFFRDKGYPIEKRDMEKEVRSHLYKEGFRGHDLDTAVAWKINNSDNYHFGEPQEYDEPIHRQLFGNMLFDTIKYYRK